MMLTGKKCKVGNKSNHSHEDFYFYEGVIASEAQMHDVEEFRLLVLCEGKLVIADTYFIYDIE